MKAEIVNGWVATADGKATRAELVRLTGIGTVRAVDRAGGSVTLELADGDADEFRVGDRVNLELLSEEKL